MVEQGERTRRTGTSEIPIAIGSRCPCFSIVVWSRSKDLPPGPLAKSSRGRIGAAQVKEEKPTFNCTRTTTSILDLFPSVSPPQQVQPIFEDTPSSCGFVTGCCVRVTAFPYPLKQTGCLGSSRSRLRFLAVRGGLVPRLYWGTLREKDFHICSGHPGIYGGRPRR